MRTSDTTRLGGRRRSCARRLSVQAPRHLEDISQALALDDADRLGQQAHQLKGIAANLGVGRLARVCDRLARTARAGDLEAALKAVAELKTATRQVLTVVEILIHDLVATGSILR